jgi:hypothetical protein
MFWEGSFPPTPSTRWNPDCIWNFSHAWLYNVMSCMYVPRSPSWGWIPRWPWALVCYQPLLHSEWQLHQQPWHWPTVDKNQFISIHSWSLAVRYTPTRKLLP